MAEVIWTEGDIVTLKKAIASGVLSVSYAGPPARSQTFQSLEAMRSLLAEMVGQVYGHTALRRTSFSKGF